MNGKNMEAITGLCRLCANECEKGTSIKQQVSNGDQILEVCNKYLHLKIPLGEEVDDLPREICPACSLNIEILVQFLDLIKDGQQQFKELRKQTEKPNETLLLEYNAETQNEGDLNDSLISEDSEEMPELEAVMEGSSNNESAEKKRKFHGKIQTVDGFVFGNIEIQTSRLCYFICNVCETSFKTENELGRHNAKHRNTIFECCVCSMRFASRNELRQHHSYLKHFGEIMIEAGNAAKNPTMGCKFCQIDFVTVEELVRHSQLAHSNQYSYACSRCTRNFDSLSLFICHVRQHDVAEELICVECGSRFRSKASYDEHKAGETACSGVFKCSKCPKRFLRKHSLVAHMRLHDENSAFQCKVCRRRFSYQKELDVHMKTHGQGDHEFICSLCNEKFNTEYLLKRHRAEKHQTNTGAKAKQLFCSICNNQTFSNLHELQKHIRTHDNEAQKQFTCPICSKVFAGNFHFKQHLQLHGEKQFICTLCGKRFSNAEYLKVHTKRHQQAASKSSSTSTNPTSHVNDEISSTTSGNNQHELQASKPSSQNPSPLAATNPVTSTSELEIERNSNQERTISMSTDEGLEDPMEPIDFDQLVQEKMVEVYSDEDLDELDFEQQMGDDMLFVITGQDKNYKKAEVEDLGTSIKSNANQKSMKNIIVNDNLPID